MHLLIKVKGLYFTELNRDSVFQLFTFIHFSRGSTGQLVLGEKWIGMGAQRNNFVLDKW